MLRYELDLMAPDAAKAGNDPAFWYGARLLAAPLVAAAVDASLLHAGGCGITTDRAGGIGGNHRGAEAQGGQGSKEQVSHRITPFSSVGQDVRLQ
jgi:hypothetical protein